VVPGDRRTPSTGAFEEAVAMKAWLTEAGETLIAAIWWGSVWVWGGLLSAMFILVPLLLANVAAEIRESLPATVALAGGVVGAYLINQPP
jgi:hypothetical protein